MYCNYFFFRLFNSMYFLVSYISDYIIVLKALGLLQNILFLIWDKISGFISLGF